MGALAPMAAAALPPQPRHVPPTRLPVLGPRATGTQASSDGDGGSDSGAAGAASTASTAAGNGGGATASSAPGNGLETRSAAQGDRGGSSSPAADQDGSSASHTGDNSGDEQSSATSSPGHGGQSSAVSGNGSGSDGRAASSSQHNGGAPSTTSNHFDGSASSHTSTQYNDSGEDGSAASASHAPGGGGISHTTITATVPPASTGSVHQTTYVTIYTTPTASRSFATTVITSTSTPPPSESTDEPVRSTYHPSRPSSSYAATTDIVVSTLTSTPAFTQDLPSLTSSSARSVVTSIKQTTITRTLASEGGSPSYTVITSASTMYAAATATGKSTGFFSNHGAVGGTFASVGIVAVVLLGLLAWLLVRKRKEHQMNADIVAATTAGAAATRQPFADDDDENDYALENGEDMEWHGHEHSSSFPTGDFSSQRGNGHLGLGPFGEFGSVASPIGASSGTPEYPPASLYGHEGPGQYEYPYYPSSDHNSSAAAMAAAAAAGAATTPSNGRTTPGDTFQFPSAEEGYGTPSEHQMYGGYPPNQAPTAYYGHTPEQPAYHFPYGGDPAHVEGYGDQQGSYRMHDAHPSAAAGAFGTSPGPLDSPFTDPVEAHQMYAFHSPLAGESAFPPNQASPPPVGARSGANETDTLASPNPAASATHAFYSEHPAVDGEDSLSKAHSQSRSGHGF